jgi:hypothetical protein
MKQDISSFDRKLETMNECMNKEMNELSKKGHVANE